MHGINIGGQPGNYQTGLQFLADFVTELPDFEDKIRAAAITFSTTAQIQVNFSTHGNDKVGMIQSLLNLPYEGGNTQTDLAFRALRTELLVDGDRGFRGFENAGKLAVVALTDGQSANLRILQAELSLLSTLSPDIDRYVIGVGTPQAFLDELLEIAGGVPENVFQVDSYDSIDTTVLASAMLQQICTSLCDEGQFESIKCEDDHDQTCTPLTPCDLTTQFTSPGATPTTDRVCHCITRVHTHTHTYIYLSIHLFISRYI